jgi:hypothetical protein
MEEQIAVAGQAIPLELETLRTILSERLTEFAARINVAVLELEDESLEVSETLDKITVTDAIEYQELGERLKIAVGFHDRASAFFEPWRVLFYGPYQTVIDRRKSVLGVVDKSTDDAKKRLLIFEHQEAERQRIAAEIANEALQRDDEARRLELASQAETAGMSREAVDAILETPSTLPTVTAAPIERPTGLSGRKNWKAEVFDKPALIMAIAERLAKGDKSWLVFVDANESKLNNEAKMYESELAIPGVRAVNKGSLAVRR